MEEFYEKINDPALNGAIFVAVCRGKVGRIKCSWCENRCQKKIQISSNIDYCIF